MICRSGTWRLWRFSCWRGFGICLAASRKHSSWVRLGFWLWLRFWLRLWLSRNLWFWLRLCLARQVPSNQALSSCPGACTGAATGFRSAAGTEAAGETGSWQGWQPKLVHLRFPASIQIDRLGQVPSARCQKIAAGWQCFSPLALQAAVASGQYISCLSCADVKR